jgi:hypothetical protein
LFVVVEGLAHWKNKAWAATVIFIKIINYLGKRRFRIVTFRKNVVVCDPATGTHVTVVEMTNSAKTSIPLKSSVPLLMLQRCTILP